MYRTSWTLGAPPSGQYGIVFTENIGRNDWQKGGGGDLKIIVQECGMKPKVEIWQICLQLFYWLIVDHSFSGWWFGTMEFYDFPYIGKFIIPTDFHILVETTNQFWSFCLQAIGNYHLAHFLWNPSFHQLCIFHYKLNIWGYPSISTPWNIIYISWLSSHLSVSHILCVSIFKWPHPSHCCLVQYSYPPHQPPWGPLISTSKSVPLCS